jgi:hypothetical protein
MQVQIQTEPSVDMNPGAFTPFSAPGVEPMKNQAPEQMMKMGSASLAIGDMMIREGNQIQEHLDSAVVQGADTNLMMGIQKVLHGDPSTNTQGFLMQAGANAQTHYDDAWKNVVDLRKQIEDGLGTDVQKQLFTRTANARIAQAQTQMFEHAAKQTYVYNMQETKANGEAWVTQSQHDYGTKTFSLDLAMVRQKYTEQADQLGLPEGSAARAEVVREGTTKVWLGVIDNLSAKGDYTGAKKVLDDAWEKNEITDEAHERMNNQVEQGYKRDSAVHTADKLFSASDFWHAVRGQESGGRNDIVQRKSGATGSMQIMPAFLEDANKALGTHYTQEEMKDPVKAQEVAEAGMGQYVQRFIKENGRQPTDTEKAMMYHGGPHGYKNPDTKDQEGVSNSAYASQVVARMGSKSYSGAMAALDSIPDRETRDMAKQRYRDLVAQKESAEKQDYQDLFTRSQDVAFAKTVEGWRDIPDADWARLKPEDQAKLRAGRPRADDPDIVLKLWKNPDLWVKGQIEQYRGLLTEDTYRYFWTHGNDVAGKENIKSAIVDTERFNYALEQAGLKPWVTAKKETAQADSYLELRVKFQDQIDALQRAKPGTELGLQEKDAILQRLIQPVKANFVSEFLGGMYRVASTESKRMFQVKDPSSISIPASFQQKAKEYYKANGIQYSYWRMLSDYLNSNDPNKNN